MGALMFWKPFGTTCMLSLSFEKKMTKFELQLQCVRKEKLATAVHSRAVVRHGNMDHAHKVRNDPIICASLSQKHHLCIPCTIEQHINLCSVFVFFSHSMWFIHPSSNEDGAAFVATNGTPRCLTRQGSDTCMRFSIGFSPSSYLGMNKGCCPRVPPPPLRQLHCRLLPPLHLKKK